MISTTPSRWAAEVLHFWFEECTPEQWFKRDDAFDQQLRQRFLPLHATIAALANEACLADAGTALAATIVLDQLSRNMFRGTPAAFAMDPKALAIAQAAIARGFDADSAGEAAVPLSAVRARRGRRRAGPLRGAVRDPGRGVPALGGGAQGHHRPLRPLPHRNAVLGRTSTPEEIAFLEGPAARSDRSPPVIPADARMQCMRAST